MTKIDENKVDLKKAVEEVPAGGHEVVHGAGKEVSDHVARADKTAAMPELEQGSAIPGLGAGGQQKLTEDEGFTGNEGSKA